MHEKGGHESKIETLPPNFCYSTEDPFYYGPVLCNFFHYRTGALIAVALELSLLACAMVSFHQFRASIDRWVIVSLAAITLFAVISAVSMFFGIFRENPKFIIPKMAVLQLQIGVYLFVAVLAVISMSVGIDLTNALFGLFARVDELERDFGPIWPFNISVVAFFSAALCIWWLAIVRGSYDYLLDKEYFTNAPSIELSKAPKRD